MKKLRKKEGEEKGKDKIEKVMHEFKEGKLKSGKDGKGGKVTDRKQAIAIALSEASKAGANIPEKKKPTAKQNRNKK